MINVPGSLLTTNTANLAPYQEHVFYVNVTDSLNGISLNLSSSQKVGEIYIYFPNGTLANHEFFNVSDGSFHFVFDNPVSGLWQVRFVGGTQTSSFTLYAYQLMNYFRYYVAGLSVMTLYSAAIFIGFDIYEEAEHGVFEYLLSLPVSRGQLVLGRSIGGGLRSFIYVGPMIAISLYVIGAINPLNFLVALFALFLFSFGVSGMSITIAVIIKSSDRFDILMGVLDALIVRLSTAMYPLAVVQAANPLYGSVTSFNPVTFAADLFRWGTGIESIITIDNPLLPLLGIIIFFAVFTFVGVIIYDKRIEGGGWQ
jgi:ABC-2 type transport system permease protein